MRMTTQAAKVVTAIVKVRTQQLELRLQANRRGGSLVGESLYRSAELEALLADLRAELRASEEQIPDAAASRSDPTGA